MCSEIDDIISSIDVNSVKSDFNQKYFSLFDNISRALDFDIAEMRNVISNIAKLREELPKAMDKALSHFKNIDRNIEGYEGLLAAQDCLPNNEKRDEFAGDFSYLSKH
jgi:type I restriction enzyme R subunit